MGCFFQTCFRSALFLLAFLLLALPASADDFTPARRIYIEGMNFYQKQRWQEASIQLELAYQLLMKEEGKHDASKQRLRYYLSQCYIRMDQHEKAEPLLALYLRQAPADDSRRGEIQEMLASVKKVIAARPPKPRERKPPPPIQPPPPPSAGAWRPAPFIVLGLGVAAVGVAVAIGIVATQTATQRDQRYAALAVDVVKAPATPPSAAEVASLHQQASTYALVSTILYAAGGALVGLGAILIPTVGRTPAPPPPQPLPSKASTSLSASLPPSSSTLFHLAY